MNYYNENDPKAAAWLRALIAEGLIPSGEVDERSIVDIRANELSGFTQCHFFAGIAGWPHALDLAGWPETRELWTGSCPCQPFSVAGRKQGERDARHLWPVFRELIRECKPATVFGEQVAAKAGRLWLSGVFADLEGMGYYRAGADLCVAGIGAPHIRQRLFWMAYRESIERGLPEPEKREQDSKPLRGCKTSEGMEHAESNGRIERRTESSGGGIASGCSALGMANSESEFVNGGGASAGTEARICKRLQGWRTPDNNNRGSGYRDMKKLQQRIARGHQVNLEDQAILATLATGPNTSCSNAETENKGVLNPEFTLWLMGFPGEWLCSKVLETLSRRHSRRNSSERQGK